MGAMRRGLRRLFYYFDNDFANLLGGRLMIAEGEITDAEKETFRYLAERNALNDGYERSEVVFLQNPAELEAVL